MGDGEQKEPREEPHYAVIKVARRFLDHLDLKIERCDTQGMLQDKGVFDQVRNGLQLPDGYEIKGIYIEYLRNTWCVGVYHPNIPIVPEFCDLPEIEMIYRPDGTLSYISVKVEYGLPRY
ncbi:MAG: hypothetical protein ACJ788_00055 [Ktedonobacteraceae bacterium]